ncbi:MAG TPA: hypothetical protein VKN14_01820 [Flavobacteriaceae bacterium]|nr:hypothetical protein [Flavobacteriaceae bacterium]
MNTKGIILLKIGLIQTIATAIYHFFIPYQFNWTLYLNNESPTINWSLISLNNYFSFNLLTLSIFLLFFLFRKDKNFQAINTLSLIVLLFWIFSFIYQIVDPMPLPNRFNWLKFLLPSIALFNAVCFSIPLLNTKPLNQYLK